jgi:hypothetical protein
MKRSILALSTGLALGLAFGLAAGLVSAQSQLPDEDLKAQKLPHEQALKTIEQERSAFERALSVREQECLQRFFSSNCLDKVTADHLREMRNFDLRREAELQALREIDAQLRARSRERKASSS